MTIRIQGNRLIFNNKTYVCAVGKSGFSDQKQEGDGKTPTGTYLLRECWYRADKLEKPLTKLPLKVIGKDDGWCDDPTHPSYNRPVKLPLEASHEKLWRDDDMYDLIIPMGYNDDPVVFGKGSAIFMHVAKTGYPGTEGCVALSLKDLLAILEHLAITTPIEITKE